MLRAWRAIFAARQTVHPGETGAAEGLAAIAMTASAAHHDGRAGLQPGSAGHPERMGIHNARELLASIASGFRYLRGGRQDPQGDSTHRQGTGLPAARPHPGPQHCARRGRGSRRRRQRQRTGSQLLPRRPAGDDRPEEAALAHHLGLDDSVQAGIWPSLGESAQANQVDRATLTAALIKARERWLKNPRFTELRQQLDTCCAAGAR